MLRLLSVFATRVWGSGPGPSLKSWWHAVASVVPQSLTDKAASVLTACLVFNQPSCHEERRISLTASCIHNGNV